jgi:hypothetical protein
MLTSINCYPVLFRKGQPTCGYPPEAVGRGDREGPPLRMPSKLFDAESRTIYTQAIERIPCSSAPRRCRRSRLDHNGRMPLYVWIYGRLTGTAYMEVARQIYVDTASRQTRPCHTRPPYQNAGRISCSDSKGVMAHNDLDYLITERTQALVQPCDLSFVDPSFLDRERAGGVYPPDSDLFVNEGGGEVVRNVMAILPERSKKAGDDLV